LNVNVVARTYVTDSIVFYSIRSTNFGQTWTVPQEIFRALVSDIPDQVSIGNSVHFVWAGYFRQEEAGDVYYIRSTDEGMSWSTNIALSTVDQHPSELVSICTRGNADLAVGWMDFKYSPYWATGDILMRSSADSGSTWGPESQATFDHYAWGSDIGSNGDTIHVAWEDEGTGLGHRSIYYSRSTDNGVTWEDPYWVDGTLDDSWTPTLAVSNGRVYAGWGDWRSNPDTNWVGGLYISRWDPEPDAINDRQDNLPSKAVLSAYPNPFNSSVIITYSNLSYESEGKGGDIGIYDVQGKLVKTLKTEGGMNGKIKWDATDASGEKVASGIYFARAQYGSEGTGASQNSIDLKLLYVK
jgi:hypothetical protein